MSQYNQLLTIASAGANTDVLSRLRHARSIVIQAPAALDAGTYTVKITNDNPSATSPVYVAYQVGGSDLTIAAGKTVTIPDVAFRGLRIDGPASQTVARDFKVVVQEL